MALRCLRSSPAPQDHVGAARREAPIDCWKRLAGEHVLPDPPGPDRIAEIFMVPSAARSVQHYGVEVNGIQYHGPALRRILENHGRQTRVEIRYDPTDIRMIMVRDPDTGTHVPVPAKEPDLPAIGFATLAAPRAANPEWKSRDITARASGWRSARSKAFFATCRWIVADGTAGEVEAPESMGRADQELNAAYELYERIVRGSATGHELLGLLRERRER